MAQLRDQMSTEGLCENAKTLNRGRRNYLSTTVLVAQRASAFNLETEFKNFEFLHSQGHKRRFGAQPQTSGLPLSTDM
jgi:hypothetical protein